MSPPIAFGGLIKRHIKREPQKALHLFYDGSGNLMDKCDGWPFIVEPGDPNDVMDIVKKAGSGAWLVTMEEPTDRNTLTRILIYPKGWTGRV